MRRQLLLVAVAVVWLASLETASPTPASAASTPGPNGPIVFASDIDGNFEIFTMNSDGSGLTQLTFTTTGYNVGPTVSPDGTTIAYERSVENASNYSVISLMDIDGGAPVDVAVVGVYNSHPAFSPDGKRLAFAAQDWDPWTGALPPSLWSVKVDGTDYRRLTAGTADDHPVYTPDGSKIVFTSTRDGGSDIYSMNAESGPVTRLTSTPGEDASPQVSPDGTKIVFVSDRDGNREIYAMNLDGSGQVRLTNDPGVDEAPSYSPSSQQIAFTSTRDGTREIYVMNADGSGQVRRTTLPAVERDPEWGVRKTLCQGSVATINGTDGNDVLTGTDGDDVIAGNGGNDTIVGLGGGDVICGGDGVDTVLYDDHELSVTANLGGGSGDDGSAEDGPLGARDSIARDVENLTGGYGDDALAGNARANAINGGPGDDLLTGGFASDKLSGNTGEDRLVGGDGADQLMGATSDDVLVGGEGNDTLSGGPDGDSIAGGSGEDTATYTDHTTGVVVTVGAGGANDGNATDGPAGGRDNVTGTTENLIGTAANDSLTGNDLDNRLTGGLGADVLLGLAGMDRLVAKDGAADTTIDCGADTDFAALVDVVDPAAVSCP